MLKRLKRIDDSCQSSQIHDDPIDKGRNRCELLDAENSRQNLIHLNKKNLWEKNILQLPKWMLQVSSLNFVLSFFLL